MRPHTTPGSCKASLLRKVRLAAPPAVGVTRPGFGGPLREWGFSDSSLPLGEDLQRTDAPGHPGGGVGLTTDLRCRATFTQTPIAGRGVAPAPVVRADDDGHIRLAPLGPTPTRMRSRDGCGTHTAHAAGLAARAHARPFGLGPAPGLGWVPLGHGLSLSCVNNLCDLFSF